MFQCLQYLHLANGRDRKSIFLRFRINSLEGYYFSRYLVGTDKYAPIYLFIYLFSPDREEWSKRELAKLHEAKVQKRLLQTSTTFKSPLKLTYPYVPSPT